MADDRNQKTSRNHAEGQHGPKTHSALVDSLHHRQAGDEPVEDAETSRGSAYGEVDSDGRHRLSEDRQQHDEAEKNSEAMKTARENGVTRDGSANGR
jgi:hypothetical protein